MLVRKIVYTLCGVALLGVLAASTADAALNVGRTTYFTFNRDVQLPGVTLPAGTYVFEVLDSHSRSDIVRVSSRDRAKVYLTQFTNLTWRPVARDMRPAITFRETPASAPPAIRAWFPNGEALGREFVY